jgi:menaquinone-specific isochorismate synthase
MMNTDLITKVFTFPEAKKIFSAQIQEFASRPHATTTQPFIKRFELRVETIDLLSWLAQQKATTKIYGSDQSDNYAIAGIGQAHLIAGSGPVCYADVFKQMQSLLTPKYPYLRFYGGMCFDDQNLEEEWKNFGAFQFVIPRFELATKEGKMLFACNILVDSTTQETCARILQELEELGFQSPHDVVVQNLEAAGREDIPSHADWKNIVQNVLQSFHRKHCEKLVLARKTQFHFDEPLNPWLILRQLKKVTPYSYHFCFQYKDNEFFLGASPERLFKREGRKVHSEAVAGTRPRGATHNEDEKLRQELLSSEKDRREHQFVVDAIKAGLAGVCTTLEKESARSVLSLENGHHLVTQFHGELEERVEDWQVLERLHPTPAVGGVPRQTALQMIRVLEPFSRGWYAGPIGYVGLDQTEFVVAIRSALVKNNLLTVYAGAGIVDGSHPQTEWDEVENKISNFLKVLRY